MKNKQSKSTTRVRILNVFALDFSYTCGVLRQVYTASKMAENAQSVETLIDWITRMRRIVSLLLSNQNQQRHFERFYVIRVFCHF